MKQHCLSQYFNQFITLTSDEMRRIDEKMEIRRFDANEFILKAGEKENHISFIEKGVVQKYFLQDKKKVVRQLAREKDMLTSSVSFVASTPSQYYIEAIEPVVLLSLRKNVFESFYRYSKHFEKLGRLLVTNWLLQTETREQERMSLSQHERFLKFMKEKPELLKRIPQKLIASLLDMQPETFSRYKYLFKQQQLKAQSYC